MKAQDSKQDGASGSASGHVPDALARRRTEKLARHDLAALKSRVKVRGLSAIDRRTSAARALLQWKAELLADLGGEANLSAQQRALVELSVRTRLYIDHADAWILAQDSIISKNRRALFPIVTQRNQLVESFSRLMTMLGIKRQPKPIPSISEYMNQPEAGKDENHSASDE
jgi:hypothetical protein